MSIDETLEAERVGRHLRSIGLLVTPADLPAIAGCASTCSANDANWVADLMLAVRVAAQWLQQMLQCVVVDLVHQR